MKRLKVVRVVPMREWDEDEGEWYYWDEKVYRKTVWGWTCWAGREFLYRTHLRRRPTTMQVINDAIRDLYMPGIMENLMQPSPLMEILARQQAQKKRWRKR